MNPKWKRKGLDSLKTNWLSIHRKKKTFCIIYSLCLYAHMEQLDNSCFKKWLVHEFCFFKTCSSGCMIICEALNNSKAASKSFKYPPSELKKCSSANPVNGSTPQENPEKHLTIRILSFNYPNTKKHQHTWGNIITTDT